MKLTFTFTVQNENTDRIPGVTVVLHPPGRPRRRLAFGTSDDKGQVSFDFDVPDPVKEIVASIFNPNTRALLHRSEPRAISKIGDSWAEEVTSHNPSRPDSPDVEAPDPQPGSDGKPGMPRQSLDIEAMQASRLDTGRRIRDGIRKAARPEIRRRLANRKRGREIAGQFLGRKPIGALGPTPSFVPAGEDPSPAIEKTRQAGMARLKDKAPSQRGWVLSEGRVKELGLRDGEKIPPQKLDELFRETQSRRSVGGGSFEAILRECSDRHLVEASDRTTSTPTDEETTADEVAALASNADLSIQERIAAILDSEVPLADERPTVADIANNLTVSVPSGPADVDAYYDFHSLQVAWLDAWTALIDKTTAAKVRDLYDSIVDVVDPDVIAEATADFSEIDELYDLLDSLEDSVQAAQTTLSDTVNTAPEWIVAWIPDIADHWSWLTNSEREYVRVQWEIQDTLSNVQLDRLGFNLGDAYMDEFGIFADYPDGWVPHITFVDAQDEFQTINPDLYRQRALAFVDLERARDERYNKGENYSTDAASRLGRAERLLGELKEELVTPYQFDVFAKGAYNFGALATYRQRWRPVSYQVGDLAGSIPLAPNEKRSYSISRTTAARTTTNQSRDRSSQTNDEFSESRRAESEITGNIKNSMSAKADVSAGATLFEVVEVDAGSEFATSQENASSRVKKELREVTRKAAQEYRDENKTSVETEVTSESTYSESREIQNPNNELTVTYLFYELQRRYEVNERLHDLAPVIMVAFDMPQPHEITEAWLLKHDWIIGEALLDESFRAALIYLRQTFAGDEVSVEILEQQWKAQLAIVADLRRQGRSHQELRDLARSAVQDAVDEVSLATAGEEYFRGGIGRNTAQRVFAAEGALADGEAENARASLDWAEQDLSRIESTAREAMTALEAATSSYVDAVEKRLNRRIQIDRLILHVKENILHYMQEIWRREHPDQRYLRLYDMEIQWPGETGAIFSTKAGSIGSPRFSDASIDKLPDSVISDALKPTKPGGVVQIKPPEFDEKRKLYQVADLRKILGFRGNLAIFRLTEDNALSTFMAQDFLDSEFGLMDPDPLGRLPTPTEALHIAQCAWKHPDIDDEGREQVTEWLMEALRAGHQVSQDVIVPTGELYIEALPGAHPLLEDFKLKHRATDAATAANQLRLNQLELLRRAMRLDAEDASDPDIDRVIQIQGDPANVNVDTE